MRKILGISTVLALAISSGMIISLAAPAIQVQNSEVPGTANGAITSLAATPLNLTLYKTYTGKYNYATAGIGVRNCGRGTILLNVPKGCILVAGYLYWTVFDLATPNANDGKLTMNGFLVTGTLVATGPATNWAPATTGYTYRAGVTSVLWDAEGAGYLSYGLTIGGMSSKVTNGTSPWVTTGAGTLPMTESVHLVLIYTDPSITSSTVQIYEGYQAVSTGVATFNYAWPARSTGNARFSHLVADCQQVGMTPFTKSITFTFGGTTTTIDDKTALRGDDPTETARATYQGSLSDTQTYNVGSLVTTAGGASTITWNISGDYDAWVGLVFATGVD